MFPVPEQNLGVDEDIPDEIQQMEILAREKKLDIIDSLGKSVAKKRDEAVKARSELNIEQEWLEDQEFYEGIDDANRSEMTASIKPNSPTGVVTTQRVTSGKSTVFLNITRPYVDAAAASISEIGNPTDDRNFAIKPTPIPQLQAHQDNPQPIVIGGKQTTVAQAVQSAMDIAQQKAKSAQDRVDDWLIQCQWHAEMRECVRDMARIGTGIMKGPYPIIRKYKKATQTQDGMVLEIVEDIDPASKRIDPWNFYPDPSCGEDIHNGSYCLERDFITVKQLRELKGLPGYLSDQIDSVIEEGPNSGYQSDKYQQNQQKVKDSDRYEIWYFYGVIDSKDLDAMGVMDDKIKSVDSCPAVVTLVNNTAIKASLNPLDSGDFPYDVIVWQNRYGIPFGIGVSRIIRTPQRMIVAANRNLMDNAGLSGGVQIGLKKGSILPADGNWNMTPVKFWELIDTETRSINEVLSFTQIPSLQQELMNIIEFSMKMAEQVSNLPLLMQGQTGSAPDTVGGMILLNKNSTMTRRQIARKIDDDLTEPHIRRYYEWIMMYGDESEKGDFTIDARGSSALVERDIQNQFAIQMLQSSLNPAYGLDPELAMQEVLKSANLDPKRFALSEAKKKQIAENAAKNPPMEAQVQAAQIRAQSLGQQSQIRAQTELQIAQIDNQTQQAKIQKEMDRDTVFVQSERERDAATNNYNMQKLQVERELAMLQYANQNKMNLDAVKAQLASKAMALRTEQQLASASNEMELALHNQNLAHDVGSQNADHAHEMNIANLKPEVQVPGRAGNGHSLDQMK